MMEKTKRDEEEMERAFEVSKPLKWEIPEDLLILWVNNFVVQHTQNEFILTFFQVTPPILIKPTPEQIEAVESVPAQAVARIALTPRAMAGLLEVMTKNYETFQKKQLESEG